MVHQGDSPVLIFDAMNLFLRTYSANPTISHYGHHVGGVVGFLKSMRNIIDKFSPSQVFVVWEGGGSQRRRAIYPEYKHGRKPKRMNKFFDQERIHRSVKYTSVTVKRMMSLVIFVSIDFVTNRSL